MKEDKIISALIGLVGACGNNSRTAGSDSIIVKALAFPVLFKESDEESLSEIINEIHSEKNVVAPNCAFCASPCGNTSDYDMKRIYEAEPEIRSIKMNLLSKCQDLAAQIYQKEEMRDKLQFDDELFYRVLSCIGCDTEKSQLLEQIEEIGTIKRKMKLGGFSMIRKIIKIDEEKCNGCGACAKACHEGAIEIFDGKARLIREDYCDGLGDCLPECPCGAITFEEREAAAYDEAAVLAAKQAKSAGGSSRLGQWPCQIKLAPVNAPYFNGAKLLIAADCTAYAYGNIHEDYMKGKITLIGCPKLDSVDYSEKLTEILKNNQIESITVLRMEVPCCGGMELAVQKAVQSSGKEIPCQVVIVSIDGKIL